MREVLNNTVEKTLNIWVACFLHRISQKEKKNKNSEIFADGLRNGIFPDTGRVAQKLMEKFLDTGMSKKPSYQKINQNSSDQSSQHYLKAVNPRRCVHQWKGGKVHKKSIYDFFYYCKKMRGTTYLMTFSEKLSLTPVSYRGVLQLSQSRDLPQQCPSPAPNDEYRLLCWLILARQLPFPFCPWNLDLWCWRW